jgi:hypothetical protein
MNSDEFKRTGLTKPCRDKVDKWPRRFILSCSVILLITGAAKIVSAMGAARILWLTDPILYISFGHLMLLAGVCELSVSTICILGRNIKLQAAVLAWLSTIFVVYRIGLLYLGWNRPCSCMGNLTDALHIPPKIADVMMEIILGYLLVGSYGILFWLWKRSGRLVSQNLLR